MSSDNIQRLCEATGRVDDPSQQSLGYQGTAFLVGDGLVMTNRHVLRAITREKDADHGTLKDNIVIDFGRELGPPTATAAIRSRKSSSAVAPATTGGRRPTGSISTGST